MMKMLIKIDETRVDKDGLVVADMLRKIDKRFEKTCTKEVQPDGAVMYSGIANRDYWTEINLAYVSLKNQPWFGKYCTQWIWYNNDDDESLPLQDLNVLEKQKATNPLFV